MPGIGHLVHMPSHIDMRLGRYAEAVESNTSAIQVKDEEAATVERQFQTAWGRADISLKSSRF